MLFLVFFIVVKELYQLPGVVWSVEKYGENKLVASVRSGELYVVDLENKSHIQVSGVPKVFSQGQGGLLDVALDGDDIYLTYSKRLARKSTTALGTGKFDGTSIKKFKDLFIANPAYEETRHYGSRIVLDGEGHIFFTVGDRGNREYAQDIRRDNGKVFRIKKKDGSVPLGNPFKNRIWSYGHRNPQGLFLYKGVLYEQEHGPRGGDEINIIEKGKNYGWPEITYGREYWGPKIGPTHKEGMAQPLYQYTPSIAPSGLVVFDGEPWDGCIFSGALKLQHLNKLCNLEEERLLEDMNERVRDVIQDGRSLIISTDSGKIFRVSPSK